MADLVGGRYPQTYEFQARYGLAGQFGQANLPVRSNDSVFCYGAEADTAGATVLNTSGYQATVPVPVDVGMTVSKVSVLVGATAASTPTHSFAALYIGAAAATGALIGQSTDGLTAAVAASTRFDFVLTTPQTITATQAPNGYVWASVSFTATTTLPSIVTKPCGATGGQYSYFAGSPINRASTQAGSGTAGTALATLTAGTAVAIAPVVILW